MLKLSGIKSMFSYRKLDWSENWDSLSWDSFYFFESRFDILKIDQIGPFLIAPFFNSVRYDIRKLFKMGQFELRHFNLDIEKLINDIHAYVSVLSRRYSRWDKRVDFFVPTRKYLVHLYYIIYIYINFINNTKKYI